MSGARQPSLAGHPHAGLSRREALGLGTATLAAATLPATLAPTAAHAQAVGQGSDDKAILRAALAIEQAVVIAYDDLLARARLSAPARGTLQAIRAQERQHVSALLSFLREIGGAPGPAPRGPADVERDFPALASVRSERQALAFAIELEQTTVLGYNGDVSHLNDQKLVQLAASIMCDEGQHLVMLRSALGQEPIPTPLEKGAPPTGAPGKTR